MTYGQFKYDYLKNIDYEKDLGNGLVEIKLNGWYQMDARIFNLAKRNFIVEEVEVPDDDFIKYFYLFTL